jgi:hypothetical protein
MGGFNPTVLDFVLDGPRKWNEGPKGKPVLLMKHVREYKKLFILQQRLAVFWFWQV